jgi:peptidoglycan/xylan/chitin deacetylase (PgdA/CDA1 family)
MKFHPVFCAAALALCTLLSACETINKSVSSTGLPPGKVVLSFDDEPNCTEDTTTRLLEVLKRYNVKAQFCMLGINVEKNPALAKRIYQAGYTIINHGYSGNWSIRMSDDEFRTNLLKGEAALEAALGTKPKPMLYRPHGGFYVPRQEAIWKQEGFTLAPTTIRLYDAVKTARDADDVFKTIMKKVKKQNGGVILLHDSRDSWEMGEAALAKHPNGPYNRSWIPALVEKVIIALRKAGYTV